MERMDEHRLARMSQRGLGRMERMDEHRMARKGQHGCNTK